MLVIMGDYILVQYPTSHLISCPHSVCLFFIYIHTVCSDRAYDESLLLIINMSSRPQWQRLLKAHIVAVACCFNGICYRPITFIAGHNMEKQPPTDLLLAPILNAAFVSTLLAVHLCFICPESRPWGATALGRLLTQEEKGRSMSCHRVAKHDRAAAFFRK